MKYSSSISGLGGQSLGRILKTELSKNNTSALGVISAYVTIGGLRELLAITQKRKPLECRLLAGISNAVTHPEALSAAIEAGWEVRLGLAPGRAIFHPKMIVSGQSFRRNGEIIDPSFIYVGSSNLTIGGLHRNIECGVIANKEFAPPGIASCFANLWSVGNPASPKLLEAYTEEFAKRNRQRSTDDIEALGVGDTFDRETSTYSKLNLNKSSKKIEAMPEGVAMAAWAGLESFTGDYQFQVEFPQAAGLVLKRLLKNVGNRGAQILCTADNTIRNMTFRYYADNGMFRLNIPNDTPGVRRSRLKRNGIALIEKFDGADAVAKLIILPPGRQLEEIVRRSVLLGTWGKTPTRKYGWF